MSRLEERETLLKYRKINALEMTSQFMNLESLEDKTAIVTGAVQGLGLAVAKALLVRGARVVIGDVDEGQIAAAMECLRAFAPSEKIWGVAVNVTRRHEVHTLVEQTVSRFGGVSILVNNAGVLRPTRVIDISEEEWDWVIEVNMKGTFLCSQAVLGSMRAAGWGRIINFSSTAGKNVSTVGGAHYTAAKAGVLGFTRHLAKEEARHGITVNSICPGLIDTDMVRLTISEAQREEYAAGFPIPRLGRPEEVAELVAFIASDRAAYITGASLDINGGDLMI